MSDESPAAASGKTGDESERRPFGYIAPEGNTAMVCEQDAAVRDKIINELKVMGYAVAQAASSREALQFMRFHIFSAIFVNENFDTAAGQVNSILRYLEGLSMTIRRQTFVVLVSAALKTMDNMTAYNKSVNLIIHKNEIGDVAQIFKKALDEYESFYHVYKENLRKQGKI
jgi:CheY-like chemotaxis protein